MVVQPKILWSERDLGQKLSIVLLFLAWLCAQVFFVVVAVTQAMSNDWLWAALGIGMFVNGLALAMKWRRRNAR